MAELSEDKDSTLCGGEEFKEHHEFVAQSFKGEHLLKWGGEVL